MSTTRFHWQSRVLSFLIEHQIPVNIMTVISAHNYQDLFDVVVNANQLGVNSVDLQPVIFVSCFPEVEPVPDKKSFNALPEHLPEIEDQFQMIMDFERDNHITTNVYKMSYQLCRGAQDQFYMPQTHSLSQDTYESWR